ncbi:AMP-binding protein [Microbulbifer sp. TRSA001]|uniref:AMP-binding protein n=1 Tax=Microbulbifer sp. TRSA001 TaxID=3243381 RepID=UPI00403A3C47
MNIGDLDRSAALSQARKLSKIGGLNVPESVRNFEDLPISGPIEIERISLAAAQRGGAILMSSGGTTGQPKLCYTPYHQAIDRLLKEWQPLSPQSVLLNLFNPGRLWGAHYFIQALADASRCTVAPTGPFVSDEASNWIEFLQGIHVNTLAGAPTGLADFAQGALNSVGQLPIESIIWMGEPWTKTKIETVRKAFPSAGFWCDYGSVETNSIAVNSPGCDLEKYHLLEGQLIETDDQGALLTRIGEGWTVPIIRYRLGDLIKPTTCRCGRPRALLIEGRADDAISLCSALLSTSKITSLAYDCTGVEEVQLLLSCRSPDQKSADRITLQFTGNADASKVSKYVQENIHNLASVAKQYPQSFNAKKVHQLRRILRTNKTPQVIWVTDDE